MAEFSRSPQFNKWKMRSNSIIVLSVPDEKTLWQLNEDAMREGFSTYEFREPDLCYELTAIAFEIDPDTKPFLANLPLAGRDMPPEGAKARERALRRLYEDMEECEQTYDQSVMDHGRSVRLTFLRLIDFLRFETTPNKWRIPDWLNQNRAYILEQIQPYMYEIERYLVMHDCGKPYCPEGPQRFTDHANISADTFSKFTDNQLILDLIRNDMWVHTMKASEIPAFVESGLALILLLSGLAEIHANAEMFGGIESDSFKIKYKQLDRRGKAVLSYMKDISPTQEVSLEQKSK